MKFDFDASFTRKFVVSSSILNSFHFSSSFVSMAWDTIVSVQKLATSTELFDNFTSSFQDIKQFTASTTVANPGWFFIEYCQVGGIGKLFKSVDLMHFITYVQLFYNNLPIDWLLESYLADKVCTIEKQSVSIFSHAVFIY